MAKPTKIRKNYRLDPALVVWVKRYAKKTKTTETDIVERAIAMYRTQEK